MTDVTNILRFSRDAFWNVPRFALLMIRKLWRNRHKYATGHWEHDPAWRWLARAGDELRELKDAMEIEGRETMQEIYDKKIVHRAGNRKWEAADLANFAMMAGLAHNVD